MSRYVDLSEKVTATFYDQEYEEWTQQTVTVADVLDSVCDDYTVLPSAQPEPCEDAVSRTFMYELGATCIAKPDGNGNLIALGRIDMLPPVTPKRKTGKWNFIGNQMFECSECGTCYTQSQFYQMRVRISDTEFPKFCPNCGADMGGKQDDESRSNSNAQTDTRARGMGTTDKSSGI